MTFALTALLSLLAATGSSIYRCQIEGEAVVFADRPCRNGTVLELKPGTPVSMAPLTDTELKRLQRVSERTRAALQARAKEKHHARRTNAAKQRKAAEMCRQAQNQIRALRVQRRKGYTLAEAAKLAKKTDVLRATIEAHC